MTTIYSNKDSQINHEQPSTNYGTHETIGSFYDFDGSHNSRKGIVLGFDISSINVEYVTSASFHFNVYYCWSATNGYDVLRLTSDFTESTVTWNSSPTYTTTNSTNGSVGSSTGWKSIDITNMIGDESGSQFGILVKCTDDTYGFNIDSKEGTNKPYISITSDDHYFVKASGGSDSNSGISWANAWATVHKGMSNTPTDGELHIGFGSYTSEPVNNDMSPTADDVTVKFETATTGGGTGTTTVEVN